MCYSSLDRQIRLNTALRPRFGYLATEGHRNIRKKKYIYIVLDDDV